MLAKTSLWVACDGSTASNEYTFPPCDGMNTDGSAVATQSIALVAFLYDELTIEGKIKKER
jgi:hypothetical protein